MILSIAAFLAGPASAPDLQIRVDVRATSASIEGGGTSSLTAFAVPDAGSTATTSGNRTSTRWTLEVDARIADPLEPEAPATSPPDAR